MFIVKMNMHYSDIYSSFWNINIYLIFVHVQRLNCGSILKKNRSKEVSSFALPIF